MLEMGLWMAPGGLMMMLRSPLGAKLSHARGPKVTLAFGAFLVALGYLAAVLMMGAAWTLLIAVCIASSGIGFAYGAMPALIMGSVPITETASANSFNTLTRSIGTSFAAAVVGVGLSSEERRVGKGGVSTGRSRGGPSP